MKEQYACLGALSERSLDQPRVALARDLVHFVREMRCLNNDAEMPFEVIADAAAALGGGARVACDSCLHAQGDAERLEIVVERGTVD